MKFFKSILPGLYHCSLFLINLPFLFAMELEDQSRKRPRTEATSPISIQSSEEDSIDQMPHVERETGENRFKFKVGFEFQASGKLCSTAPHSHAIQKHSIFKAMDSEHAQKLWHVEIDGMDIEFVTIPFTREEKTKLVKCITSIQETFLDLVDSLKIRDLTFGEWFDHLQKEFYETGKQKGIYIKEAKILRLVETLEIRRSLEGTPSFQPQVTIQHPLEYTIPLSFSLFGYTPNPYMQHFIACLPYFNMIDISFRSLQQEGNFEEWKTISEFFTNKLNGLIFLHALTMESIAALEDQTDKELLKETLKALNKSGQIDAKMKVPLMSRRPFSAMLQEISINSLVQEILGEECYSEYFMKVMEENDLFIKDRKVPSLLYKANYAKQFLDEEGTPIPLFENYKDLFEETFLRENEEVLKELLNQGVVSTAMIRNFQEIINATSHVNILNIQEEYYLKAIKTVEDPTNRFTINGEGQINNIPSQYDMFSPPWFLDEDDSMGKYKATEKIDPQYGEAIIEFRSIRDVQASFLTKKKVQVKKPGFFLISPGQLVEHAEMLFDFLHSFGREENFMDFNLGLSYITRKI